MEGWRARLGFLILPGNPTVEPELVAMIPRAYPCISRDWSPVAPPESHHGQEQRNRSQIEHIDDSAAKTSGRTPRRVGIRSIFGVHDHH